MHAIKYTEYCKYVYIYIITNPKQRREKCRCQKIRPLEQLCLQRLTAGAKSAEMIREIIKFRGVEKTH